MKFYMTRPTILIVQISCNNVIVSLSQSIHTHCCMLYLRTDPLCAFKCWVNTTKMPLSVLLSVGEKPSQRDALRFSLQVATEMPEHTDSRRLLQREVCKSEILLHLCWSWPWEPIKTNSFIWCGWSVGLPFGKSGFVSRLVLRTNM